MTTWYLGKRGEEYGWIAHESVKSCDGQLIHWKTREFADEAAEKIGDGAFAITITY